MTKSPIPEDVMRLAASVEYDRETSITNAVARAIMADREARDAGIKDAALEEAAIVARQRFTRDNVLKSTKGEPYASGLAAIQAGKLIAASIRSLKGGA